MVSVNILGIVTARGGSKGIPKKNVYPLNGKPLIQYTLDEALQSNLCDLILTTDDEEISRYYYKTVTRPPHLAQDDTPKLPVIKHALEVYGQPVDAVMILQPTSPLRIAEDINKAIGDFINFNKYVGNADSLVSVCEGVHPIKMYDHECKPFFEYEPYDKHVHKCYQRNGAIFIATKELIDSGRIVGDNPLFHVMPKSRSIDIDDYQDLMMAEAMLKVGELH